MNASSKKIGSVDEYIASFPPEIQSVLKRMRSAIREAAPGAEEAISYGMPAFKQEGVLVYFAAFKEHISFFPTSSGVSKFKKELSGYLTSKGTVRFSIGEPIPLGLIKEIVAFRVKENLEKASRRKVKPS
jgi:uncharacterized protein YdhG (YjbR/CyaY superfamily)